MLGMNTLLLGAAASLGIRIWAYAVRRSSRLAGCCLVLLPLPMHGSCTTQPQQHSIAQSASPCPLQLLPHIGLHWVVPIEALHAITYACGWSGGQARVGWRAAGGQTAAVPRTRSQAWTSDSCVALATDHRPFPPLPSLQPQRSTAARSHRRAWRAPRRWGQAVSHAPAAGTPIDSQGVELGALPSSAPYQC